VTLNILEFLGIPYYRIGTVGEAVYFRIVFAVIYNYYCRYVGKGPIVVQHHTGGNFAGVDTFGYGYCPFHIGAEPADFYSLVFIGAGYPEVHRRRNNCIFASLCTALDSFGG